MNNNGVSSALNLGNDKLTPSSFVFLNQVINESMRFNPPAPVTDEYKIQRDCHLG